MSRYSFPRREHPGILRDALVFVLVTVLAWQPVPAQTVLPALGDGLEISLGAERRIGDRIARELYRSPDYLDDPVLGEYVQSIWQRLMAAARQRAELSPEQDERLAWQLLLGRNRSVNAFALPGGYLGVHLGLIAVVSSEDELAAVLGHELSHVTQRHIARIVSRQGQQAPWLIGAMILGALAAGSNPGAAGAVMVGGQAAAVQGQLNFSRDMEREADRIGYAVATQAGFDPQGFVAMFEKLEQANRFNDTGAFPYLRSHPLTTERMADMQARQQLMPLTPPKNLDTTHAMMAARAGVLANLEVDALRSAIARADATALHGRPVAVQAGVLYGAALAAQQLRESTQAQRLLTRLQTVVQGDGRASRQVRLLGAEIALAGGDAAQALQWLGVQGATAPGRAALFLRARAAIQLGQPAAAADSLQTWLVEQPRDAQAWQLLAQAYTAQGQLLRALRAQAEAQAAQMDYAGAHDRLRAAQELVRRGGALVDHVEASIIDTRSREIESMLREQALER